MTELDEIKKTNMQLKMVLKLSERMKKFREGGYVPPGYKRLSKIKRNESKKEWHLSVNKDGNFIITNTELGWTQIKTKLINGKLTRRKEDRVPDYVIEKFSTAAKECYRNWF